MTIPSTVQVALEPEPRATDRRNADQWILER
jgi:hypothetical protein